MRIDSIIKEEINRFLVTEGLFEKSHHAKDEDENPFEKENEDDKEDKPKKKKIRKNAIKLKNGHRKDYEISEDEEDRDATDEEQYSVIQILKNPAVNLAAIARKMYSDHTPEGAQSQLRKKMEGEIADSGHKYCFTIAELKKLRKILASFGLS